MEKYFKEGHLFHFFPLQSKTNEHQLPISKETHTKRQLEGVCPAAKDCYISSLYVGKTCVTVFTDWTNCFVISFWLLSPSISTHKLLCAIAIRVPCVSFQLVYNRVEFLFHFFFCDFLI